MRREIFKLANERTATVISPERFAQLWGQLEEIEIFKLPRHRGGIPPQDKPSISLTSGNRTWIVLPPPQDSESFKSLYETWANAKKLIYVYAF